MIRKQLIKGCLIAVFLLSAACSKPTTVSSVWHEQRQASGPYTKIMVVGISADATQRRRFEVGMVQALQATGNVAVSSILSMPASEMLTNDTIAEAVKSAEADAILITRLVSAEITTEEIESRTGVKTTRKNEYVYDFFRYDYNEYEEPEYLIAKKSVVLSTDFYETNEGQLLFSIDTTTYQKETTFEIISESTDAIARRLKREGLVR